MNEPDVPIKLRIARILREEHQTAADLMAELDLNKSYAYMLVRGERCPSTDKLLLFAENHKTNLSYVLGLTEITYPCETYQLHNRIQEIRNKKGFSRSQLAGMCDLSQQSLALYEANPEKIGPAKTLAVMAQALEVSVDYLLGLTKHQVWEELRDDLPVFQIGPGCPGFIRCTAYYGYFLLSDDRTWVYFANGEKILARSPELIDAVVMNPVENPYEKSV